MKINKIIILTFFITKISDGEFQTNHIEGVRIDVANDIKPPENTENFTEGVELYINHPAILLIGKTGK
jgi:hypothetical protein